MSSHRDKWDARYAEKELVWSAGPNATLAEQVRELTPGRALDVACGEGRNALWLAEQGWAVTAVDFSSVAIDKARQISTRRNVDVEWRVQDVSTAPLERRHYDLVVVAFLHTDPETRARWLPGVIDAVGEGGTFLYIGHDPSNIEHGTGGPQDTALLPGADVLTAALSGFRVTEAAVIERKVTSDPGHGGNASLVALDTLVRAERLAP